MRECSGVDGDFEGGFVSAFVQELRCDFVFGVCGGGDSVWCDFCHRKTRDVCFIPAVYQHWTFGGTLCGMTIVMKDNVYSSLSCQLDQRFFGNVRKKLTVTLLYIFQSARDPASTSTHVL